MLCLPGGNAATDTVTRQILQKSHAGGKAATDHVKGAEPPLQGGRECCLAVLAWQTSVAVCEFALDMPRGLQQPVIWSFVIGE